jgi:hypothetical protein
MRYDYVITGTAANGQTWTTRGTVEAESASFLDTPLMAMQESFESLTQGKAVYGQPGVGCRGPYQVTAMHIMVAGAPNVALQSL